jgi:hypothetical protein
MPKYRVRGVVSKKVAVASGAGPMETAWVIMRVLQHGALRWWDGSRWTAEQDQARLYTHEERAWIKRLSLPVMGLSIHERATVRRKDYCSEFYHRKERNADGTPVRCRVTGKCKTWKTRPTHFRLSVKHGMYDSFYLTHENAHEWGTEYVEVKSGPKPTIAP